MGNHTSVRCAVRALAMTLTVTGAGCGSAGDPPAADGGGGDGDGDGGPTSTTCETRGGTRLREVVRHAADGSEEHEHFQDSDFETACEFAPASDGSLRCLPLPGGRFRTAETVYTDSECHDAVAQISTDQPAGDLMQLQHSIGCLEPASAYHEIGADAGITEGQQTYILEPYAGCTAYRLANLDTEDYRTIGTEISLSAFVDASETLVGDGRLRVPRLDGADGSSECRAGRPLRDEEQDHAACDVAIADDGVRRCMPLGRGPVVDGIFSDADCAVPVHAGLINRTCEPDATVIRENVDHACGSVLRVRPMGTPLDRVYWQDPGECGPAASEMEFYDIGEPVASDRFAALVVNETPAGDRLLRLDLTGEGARFPSGFWRDPDMGADCRFEPAADGETRCLPTPTLERPQAIVSSASLVTYADADCTEPIRVATLEQTADCGGAAPTYAVLPFSYLDDVPAGSVFPLGALITDPIYRMAGSCQRYSPGVDLYAVGDAIASESFVSAPD
jgi:hypothetical protein